MKIRHYLEPTQSADPPSSRNSWLQVQEYEEQDKESVKSKTSRKSNRSTSQNYSTVSRKSKIGVQDEKKSVLKDSSADNSAESTCDDDLNFQDMRSLFQDLDLDRDSELQITKWSLQFTNEAVENEFMTELAVKKKQYLNKFILMAILMAIGMAFRSFSDGSMIVLALSVFIVIFLSCFWLFFRFSRHYVRFYSKSVNTILFVSSLLIISARVINQDRGVSVLNTTATMVFLTWMRGKLVSAVSNSIVIWIVFFLGSLTYMDMREIMRNVVPFSLSTAAQILVAYHLERNDRRLFRTRKLDAEYKSRLLAKEAKTNDILRKTYPPFVADELRSASSLHSLSHTSKHALIIHMRIHFGLAQTSLNSEQSAQVFTWLREFQVFVDKLCRRSEVKNLCKVKFSGDMTLMVCGISQPMTNFDVENTIRLIDRLMLHVQSRHSAQQARLVVVASIGPVESGIVVCQKQSYDVYGAGLSSSLVLLDRVWLSSEHGQSLFVVTTDVCNHAEGEYDKVTVDGVSSSQQLYQRVSLRIASKSKRHKEGTTDETQAESGALRVMHERIYDDEASESTKSVSLGAQEDGHGLCLLPGEAARYEQDFQLIADRESYLHQLKLLKAAVPYVSMLVLWSIYWGSMEYSIFVDAGIQSSDEIMQLMFVRFFVILPCIVLWTAWCGFEIEWLEREPDGFALQCFTFGLLCCVVVQGLFVSFKVFLLYRISMEVDDLNFYHHYFFNNEFLLWVLLSTSVAISTSRLSRYSAIYWTFIDSSVQLMFPSETGYSSFFSVVVTVIIYSIIIGIVIFNQGNTVTLTRNQQVESNILIQKEIHRSKVEQLIAERIILSVIPDSLYHSITDGSFVNTPHSSRLMVVVVNVSHFCSSTVSLHAEFKAQVLSELFSFLEMFASRYNITPLKTFADRYIFYGDSSESSDVHVQCLRFAMDLQSLCQVGLSLPHETHCRLKIGAAFGGVVGGIVDANGLSYDLLGDCVTNANVLSRLCPVDQVLIDESAHSLVESCREYAYYEFRRHRSDVHGKCFVVQESDDIWARFMSHIDWMKDD